MEAPENNRFYQNMQELRGVLEQIRSLVILRMQRQARVDSDYEAPIEPAEYTLGRILQICEDAKDRSQT